MATIHIHIHPNYRSKRMPLTRDAGRSAAGILFYTDSQVLLLKRATGDHIGTWGFPGGAIEPGETPKQAALREAKEEIAHTFLERWVTVNLGESQGFHAFGVRVLTPFPPGLNHEHSDYQWADLGDLPQGMHPNNQIFVDRLVHFIHSTNRDQE